MSVEPQASVEIQVSEQRVSRIADEYFEPNICARPRAGFQYGENPYQKYNGEKFIPDSNIHFIQADGKLRPTDVFPGSWLKFSTASGSIYTLHIIEDTDDGRTIGIGRVDRSKPSYQEKFIVGRLELPEVGKRADFTEYAQFDHEEEIQDVRYLDPKELKKRIEARIRELFQESGDSWLNWSYVKMNRKPNDKELSPIITSNVTQIELGL